MRIAFIQICLLYMSVSFTPPPQKTEVVVAAAADLKFAMDSLVAVFSKNNPDISIKVVYGSSGNFFQQIGNGAPFDLFFSADIDYPKQLTAKHLTLSVIHVLWHRSARPVEQDHRPSH